MIHVREGKPEDSPFIVDFQLKMALETEELTLDYDTVLKGVNAVFSDPDKGAYYVAEKDNMVIGSLMTTYEWSDWRNGRVLWIQSVYVEKEHRGKGVYRKMYAFVKKMVQQSENDFRGIRLYVDKSNHKAQQVYTKLGMENHHYELYEWMNDY